MYQNYDTQVSSIKANKIQEKTKMVTKKETVEQVLATVGTEKMTMDAAIAAAEVIKPLNNKNKARAWKDQFVAHGTVTKDETGTYVTAKVVVTPVVETPAVTTE